jgi:hypothetical protein
MLLIDVFPIYFDLEKYPLTAYKINTNNPSEIGHSFAYQIRKNISHPSVWFAEDQILITPASVSEEQVKELLQDLWNSKTRGFGEVRSIGSTTWQPTPKAIAHFVARGILEDLKRTEKHFGRKPVHSIKGVIVQREVDFKGVEVNGHPALQMSVRSPISSTLRIQDLPVYDVDNLQNIVGLGARCKDTKGEIVKIVGSLGEHRARFKSWDIDTYDPSILDMLADSHPIVSLKAYGGNRAYDYPLHVLMLNLDLTTLKQTDLSAREVNNIVNSLKISPRDRYAIVHEFLSRASNVLEQKFDEIKLGQNFNSETHPHQFIMPNHIGIENRLRFARGTSLVERDTQMVKTLLDQGIYKRHHRFQNALSDLRVGVLDAITGYEHREERNKQLKRFAETLQQFGFSVTRAAEPVFINEKSKDTIRKEVMNGLNQLVSAHPDIILIYLNNDDELADDELSIYNTAKRICIGHGIPSQIIKANTISNKWADDNILMGIIGKTGNIPYVLANPIEYTDILVGLDVSRRIKATGKGTRSFAALSRIYTNDGALLGYRTSTNVSIDGETIPQHVLESILPAEEFANKRVVIHRDGRFVGSELEDLLAWAKIIDAEFYPIEVTKSGVPRMYEFQKDNIKQVPRGAVFVLNDNEAYFASTPPPSGRNGAFSTSQPIRIANYSKLSMSDAINSVMALTLIHYGSTRATRLPVSIHASDKIAEFLSKNIAPKDSKGDIPFWL